MPANNNLKESQSTTESVEKENQPGSEVGSDSSAAEPAKTEDSDADTLCSSNQIHQRSMYVAAPLSKKSSSPRSTLFSGQAKTGGRDWVKCENIRKKKQGKAALLNQKKSIRRRRMSKRKTQKKER